MIGTSGRNGKRPLSLRGSGDSASLAGDLGSAAYVTNFSPHYDGDDISRRGSWLEVSPLFVREPLRANIWPTLRSALDSYGRIPPISEEGLLT